MIPLPETVADAPAETPAQPHGLTIRALLIGLVLVPALCAWNVYCDIVAQATEMAVLSLSVGVVFALLVLLGLNALVRAAAPGRALSRAELLYIYVMQTASIGISGVGMVQFLCTGLGNVFYYADDGNRWAQKYQPLLPHWAFPDPTALPDFYAGRSTLLTGAHLRGWLSPVLVWSGFLLILLLTTFCLSALLRRRWVDQERLTFPIVALPLALTGDEERPIWHKKAFWWGAAVAFGLENLAAFAHLFPTLPFLPLKASDPRLSLNQMFAGLLSAPPWNAVGEMDLSFYPLVIGLVFLLPTDVSFSCWFFFLLRKLEDVLATAWGWRDPGAGPVLSRFPYIGEQGLGAFLGLAVFPLWAARGEFRALLRRAFRRGGADGDEPLPYRGAALGIIAGFVAMTGFAVALGVPLLPAVALLGLYLLVVVAYTRLRAEAGLPWAFGPDMTPHQAVVAALGSGTSSLRGLVGLTQFQWLDLDYRCTVMPNQLEGMKIATDANLNRRHLTIAVVLATVVGLVSSWGSVLACYYRFGAATARVDDYRVSIGSAPWNILDGWTGGFFPTDWPRLAAVGVGTLVTGLLAAARARFLWWPLSPIGYVLSGTFTMVWIWCAVFVGWLAKSLLLRYGGLAGYRFALPFFIGLILGDYVAGSLWAVYGCLTGIHPYRVVPI